MDWSHAFVVVVFFFIIHFFRNCYFSWHWEIIGRSLGDYWGVRDCYSVLVVFGILCSLSGMSGVLFLFVVIRYIYIYISVEFLHYSGIGNGEIILFVTRALSLTGLTSRLSGSYVFLL